MASKPRQSHSVSGSRGDSGRVKEKKESPPVPDSTTEPPPIPVQRFQEGDEVFYQTDTRQQMLGTVAEVRGETCLVQFGDGTEQVAQFKRLKKLFEDEEEVVPPAPKRKKSESTPAAPPQPRPQQTCTSCGVSRRITATKAKLYENDLKKFNCRRCVKNSQTSKNSHLDIMSPITTSSLKGKLPPDISIIPTGAPASAFSLPSTSSSNSLMKPKSPSHHTAVSISKHIQFSVVPVKKNFCFSCEQLVQPFDSVGCNFCDRPCHLSCLHLSPTPLNGDTFWHLVCSTCGNQNSNEKVEKKFGVRRNLANWGDLAYLLISCLSVASSHRMFDFEKEMLPFLERNWDSLHIPRQFKSHPSEARSRFILNALQNSPHRFQNGKEIRLKITQWGNRSNGYGIKDRISTIATQMGLKPTVKSGKVAPAREGNTQGQQASPDLPRSITSTKTSSFCSSSIPIVNNEYESDTSSSRSDFTESSIDRESPQEEVVNHAFPPAAEDRTVSGSVKDSDTAVSSMARSSSLHVRTISTDPKSSKSPTRTHWESPRMAAVEKHNEVVPVSLKLHNQISELTSPPRAIKSASIVPLSPNQLKDELDRNKRGQKRERPKSPVKSQNKTMEGIENSLVSRPKRGRPSASASKVGTTIKRIIEPAGIGRTLRRNNPKAVPPIVSRRVGTFNSISERRPVPPEIEDSSAFNFVNELLFEAALYSGYRIQCLPQSPGTEVDKIKETLKVFTHLRIEKDAEMASSLLGRGEAETRSQTRRKSELFFGSQNRDLNDFDSYEVIGKRVDPNGITRYQVLWKSQGEDFSDEYDDFDIPEHEMEVGTVEALNPFMGSD